MLTDFQCRILKRISPAEPEYRSRAAYKAQAKLKVLLGDELLSAVAGRTVIDLGCGEGSESVELAQCGARRAIGIDIREELLETPRQKASEAGIEGICHFTCSTNDLADVVVSIDAFEHFDDPAAILRTMDTLLHRSERSSPVSDRHGTTLSGGRLYSCRFQCYEGAPEAHTHVNDNSTDRTAEVTAGIALCNRGFHLLVRLFLRLPVRDLSNNLKLYRAEILKELSIEQARFAANAETGLKPLLAGYDIEEVPKSWINRSVDMGSSSVGIAEADRGYLWALMRVLYKNWGRSRRRARTISSTATGCTRLRN